MTFDQALQQLEEMMLKMDLRELPSSRIKLAHLDAKLVSQINKLQKASQENQN
jgi:hypothetical protein